MASIRVMKHAFLSLRNIALMAGLLFTYQISVLVSITAPTHRWTVPLHNSAVSSILRGMIVPANAVALFCISLAMHMLYDYVAPGMVLCLP